jgi:hypothetical protein
MAEVPDKFREESIIELMAELVDSGDSFVLVRCRGNTDVIHNFVHTALVDTPLWQNVVSIQSVVVP